MGFDAFCYYSCSLQGMHITQWVRIRVLPLFTGHILFIRIEFLILGTTFRNKERNSGLFRCCPLGCWADSLTKARSWLIMRVERKQFPCGNEGKSERQRSTFVASQQEQFLVQGGLLLHLPDVLQRQQLVRGSRGRWVCTLV